MNKFDPKAIIDVMVTCVEELNLEEEHRQISYLLKKGIYNLVSVLDRYDCKGAAGLSTQELATLKGVSESSVSSVKKAIANGKSEFETLSHWLLDSKKVKEVRQKEKTKQAIQNMDKSELIALLAGLGIEIK